MEGIIFNIKRFAIHDGPGIRVTFFMKGCPLNCWWCHNPESISPDIESVERIDRVGEKEFRVDEKVGMYYSVSDLEEVVEKDRIFIDESNGGVTFSGGEPLMQGKFVLKAMEKFCDLGVHTCLDTSGQADSRTVDSIIPYTDLFLFDIKHLNSKLHKKYTGVSNRLLLSNFERIIDSGKEVIIRVPVIPGYNDDSDHITELRDYLVSQNSDNIQRVDLLPYHKTGASKYSRFGIPFKMSGVEQPTAKRMNDLKEFFSEPGFKVKIGG